MNKYVVEVGTMLYHPTRKSLGWIVGERQLGKTLASNGYTMYRVEWANSLKIDNLTKDEVNSYHQKYLDLANDK